MNLVLDTGTWLFLGMEREKKLPYEMQVEEGPWQSLRENVHPHMTFTQQGNRLVCNAEELRLDVSKAELHAVPFMQEEKKPDVSLPTLEFFLSVVEERGEENGLEINSLGFIERYLAKMPMTHPLEKQLAHLLEHCLTGEVNENDFRFLMGRGKGLTPSGDDLLIGWLAVDSATALFGDGFRSAIARLARTGVTTDVSKNALLHAVDHLYPSDVTATVRASLREEQRELKDAINSVLATGHTSGADTLFGILTGLVVLRKQTDWRKAQ
ncbi:DUF2877 domain-containing protein [Shouchella shacheensis]|uniref:DUF2877 domain-containing protein n=1 Tax=Shouchella shacheensis TaxID=1649580 RepID=UPI0015D58ADC|nr:DUF2877 domain-containing protein [Shouchella shacheensis]